MTVSETRSPAQDPALAPAYAAAQAICRRRARAHYVASFFLPPHKRRAAYAVGAFCRMIEDALDVPADAPLVGAAAMRQHPAVVSPARSLPVIQANGLEPTCDVDTLDSRLEMLRDRLDEIYQGRLELPSPEARSEPQHALCAFAQTVRRFEIPRQHFLDFADGCRMDRTMARYPTWDALLRYCQRTGGAVARMMGCVLGVTHSDVSAHALALGSAMRVTAILRDVREDVRGGRIYLPQADLERFDYAPADLSRGVVDERFIKLMKHQVERARRLYRDGAAGLCWLAGDGSRLAVSLLTVAGAGVLDAIERQRHDVFSRRARLTPVQKIALLPRAWKLARRAHDQPLPNPFR